MRPMVHCVRLGARLCVPAGLRKSVVVCLVGVRWSMQRIDVMPRPLYGLPVAEGKGNGWWLQKTLGKSFGDWSWGVEVGGAGRRRVGKIPNNINTFWERELPSL